MPPSPEDVLTITPSSPPAIIRGTNVRIPFATPNTLTPKHHRQSFASCSHGSPPPPEVTPALLNSRWHAPWRSYTASASASTDAGSETSVWTPLTSPRSASSVTVVWSTGVSTSAITTLAPASSNACTMPRPMPDAPPVTTATFPFTSVSPTRDVASTSLNLLEPPAPLTGPAVPGRSGPRQPSHRTWYSSFHHSAARISSAVVARVTSCPRSRGVGPIASAIGASVARSKP